MMYICAPICYLLIRKVKDSLNKFALRVGKLGNMQGSQESALGTLIR